MIIYLPAIDWNDAMTRDERLEMSLEADGTDTRTTASVRDGERLVEVQVTYIGTDGARSTQTQLGVHVGTIHVDLAAMFVNFVTN